MENEPQVVNQAPDQTPSSEAVQTQTQLPEAPVVTSTSPATQPGDKTESALLLESLQEERRKRRELEDKLNQLTTTTPSEEEVYSDEGKLLQGKISTLEAKLAQIEEEKNLEKLYSQYPVLREKASEFVEYRNAEHPRAKLESVAKLYLAENGLLEPTRKGLEKPTGGTKAPATSDLTAEDVERLRTTDYRKYRDLLMKGLIKV